MTKDKNTEKKIFEAARRVFLKKGLAGSRMQEIADEAAINKALLHYYFRSKEKLFEAIFSDAIHQISMDIKEIFEEEMNVIERVRSIINLYIDTLSKNRYLPLFVLNEMNQHPKNIERIISEKIVVHLQKFVIQVQQEAESGKIKPVHPIHLLLNVLSMVIFPFAAYPVISGIAGRFTPIDFDQFFEERKKVVFEFFENALKP